MNVVDYVILGIIGVSLLFGLYRGFIASILNTGGTVLSFFISYKLAPKLAAMIQSSEELKNTLIHYTDATNRIGDIEMALTKVKDLTQERIMQILSKVSLPYPLNAILESNLNGLVYEKAGVETVADYVSQTILNACINVLCFIIAFIVVTLAFAIVVNVLKAIFRFPVLKQLDTLVGGIFGLLRGALICYVLFAVIPIIMTVVPLDFIKEYMDSSTLLPIFNNGNLFLSIMNGHL